MTTNEDAYHHAHKKDIIFHVNHFCSRWPTREAMRDLVSHRSDLVYFQVHSEEKVDFLMVFGSLIMIELVLFKFLACDLTLSCEMTHWAL